MLLLLCVAMCCLEGNSVRNLYCFFNSNTIRHFTEHYRKWNIECCSDGAQQFRGCFLLTSLNFGEVPQRYSCIVRYLAKGAALALTNVTQHVANLFTQHWHGGLLGLVLLAQRFASLQPTGHTIYDYRFSHHI